MRPCTYYNRLNNCISFFIWSLLRTVPLIGVLLLSTAPVQAFETLDELDNACGASDEAFKLCTGVFSRAAASVVFGLLCKLREEGVLTPEEFATEYNKEAVGPKSATEFKWIKVMRNSGITTVLEDYPDCPIKPLP